ncbi:MAG: phenylalanine--tRNA ligase subunit alpha, partial [Candidatus Margulisbacteria bacterium]|nr:phenylalanine--tRNA ligase subunit alpha [Candidatus Margulisiibacteriota bacterium]
MSEEKIKAIKDEALRVIQAAQTTASLEEARVRFTGKKSDLQAILSSLGTLATEERPRVGMLINEAKVAIDQALRDKKVLLLRSEQS